MGGGERSRVTGYLVGVDEGWGLVACDPPQDQEPLLIPPEDSFGSSVADLGEFTLVAAEWLDDLFMIEPAEPAQRARSNTLKYKGGGLVRVDEHDAEIPIDPETLLPGLAEHAQMASNLPNHDVLVLPDGRVTWKDPSLPERLEQRLRDRERAGEQASARQRRDAVRQLADSVDHFVNPYNFVPLPSGDALLRSAPQGHERLTSGNVSGVITLGLTARSPLLIRTIERDGHWRPSRHDGRVVIPGSGIKGALRSLHESLVGGCLRVFDSEFVPAYRETAKSIGPDWTMALVRQADDNGRPTDVQLCDTVVWVKSSLLGSGIETGDRYAITDGGWEYSDFKKRNEVTDPTAVRRESGGQWVVLVTPSEARDKRHPYYAAVGRLSSRSAEVTPEAFANYRQLIEHARDVVDTNAGKDLKLDVMHQRPIGRRQAVAPQLPPGTVLWVRESAGVISAVKRSAIWRAAGSGRAGERIPDHLLPCSHGNDLCPTCQLFGSADDSERERESTRATYNYRGHVRVGDATSRGPIPEGDPVELAASSAPRPGSGQMYLEHTELASARTREASPTARWGAAPDGRSLRRLRGRKFYWSSWAGADAPVKRHLRHIEQSKRLTTKAELIDEGTVFEVPIHFENLTPAQLGSLLAVCDPNLCLPRRPVTFAAAVGEQEQRLTIRVGGGKPLGLGIVESTSLVLRSHTAEQRYLSRQPAGDATADEIFHYVKVFQSETPEAVRDTWSALSALLDPGAVNARRVSYPPKHDWGTMERSGSPNGWKPGFAFFKNSQGEHSRSQRPIVPLPPADDPLQYLPIDPATATTDEQR